MQNEYRISSQRNWKVRSWKPVRFSTSRSGTSVFNSPFIIGYHIASSSKEAFEIAIKAGEKAYEVEAKNGDVVYPPGRANEVAQSKKDVEDYDCPFG